MRGRRPSVPPPTPLPGPRGRPRGGTGRLTFAVTRRFRIEELAGNVATREDGLSIAFVRARAGAAEPWLTLHYDEWIAVQTGSIRIEQEGQPDLTVGAGQTVKISSGTRFRPSFPEDTTYIPVCVPAFRPDRCVREE